MLNTLLEYFKDHHIDKLTKEDCFCQLNGNTASIEQWFHNNFDNINSNKLNANVEFEAYLPDFNVWRHKHFDKETSLEIVRNNETLSKINEVLEISHCLVMEISVNSWVAWHYDTPRKGPVINLLLTPNARSHSMFTHNIFDTSNLVECEYQPHRFCLYNTEIIHSVMNFNKVRYTFSVVFERGKTDLSWEEAKEKLSSIGVI